MNISRFFGSTSREAMRQVRMALGPDAMIVSNRRVNGGVEIMAADATALETSTSAVVDTATVAPVAQAAPSKSTSPSTVSADVPPRGELIGAIGAMQGALESRIDELLWSHELQRTPDTITLFQRLLTYGFSTALLRAMLKRLPAQLTGRRAFEWARQELDANLPVLASEDLLWQPGIALALVGPTGVGKTTTIAKLAARCVRRFGSDKLVLITTDTYRIGAHEQLKIYGNILRVPVHVVQDAQALRQVMLSIKPEQVVLIDNVGISQRDRYVSEQAALLASSGRRVQRLLALNASSHGDTLDEVARVYKTDGGSPLVGCIITKVDEANRIGAALDTAIRYQLPIHYVSNGQKVPEHLQFLTAPQLVDMAFSQAPHHAKALYAPTAGDVAALLAIAEPTSTTDSQKLDGQRHKMLTNLLLNHGSGATVEQMSERLQAQFIALEQNLSLASAFEYWDDLHAKKGAFTDLVQHGESLLRSAKHEITQRNVLAPALCTHQVSTFSKTKQRFVNSYLCSFDGVIYNAPHQLVASDTEWLSTSGQHVLESRSHTALLTQAISWVADRYAHQHVIHAFDEGGVSFWRHLVVNDLQFIAAVPASLRFWHKGGRTTAKALSKSMLFNAVNPVQCKFTHLAGLAIDELSLWIATEKVELVSRGQDNLQLELICLRVVNRNTNQLVRDHFVLANISPDQQTDSMFATYLMAQMELKLSSRVFASAWSLSVQKMGQSLSLYQRVRFSALLAAATTNVLLLSEQQALRTVLQQLAQERGVVSVPKTLEALLKLFMLKNLSS